MVAQPASAQEEVAFDVAAAIAAFLSNQPLTSLELPRFLTAEQRRQAKKLADQHEGLKCESFGFGAERRLNLFKQGPAPQCEGRLSDAVKSAVRVKNTFIDDFIGAEGCQEGSAEPQHFRSLPNRLNNEPSLAALAQEAACGAAAEGKPADTQLGKAEVESAVPAGAGTSDGQPGGESPAKQELPKLPAGFKFTVRDTFIHIEEEPAAVERITQSMPDGVFLRRLEEELDARAAAAAAAAAAAPAVAALVLAGGAEAVAPPPVAEGGLTVGTEVTIEGLLKLPVFNGLTGTVDSYDAQTGRYNVLLDAPSAGSRWAKVRGENLKPRVPPPPLHAPTLAVEAA